MKPGPSKPVGSLGFRELRNQPLEVFLQDDIDDFIPVTDEADYHEYDFKPKLMGESYKPEPSPIKISDDVLNRVPTPEKTTPLGRPAIQSHIVPRDANIMRLIDKDVPYLKHNYTPQRINSRLNILKKEAAKLSS